MRLIDADKLLPKLWVCYEENKPIVDAEPTVEAIPIELIYKIRNLYLKNDCFISAGVCNEILNMWGKENEAN